MEVSNTPLTGVSSGGWTEANARTAHETCGLATRRTEDGEGVRHLEAPRDEAVQRRRPAACGTRRTVPACRLQQAPAYENALQVGRRDRVAEGGGVDLAQLGDRKRLGSEREADVRVRQLRPEALPTGERDVPVVERELGQVVDGVPARVAGEGRIEVDRHEAHVRRRELPFARVPGGVAARLELFEVRDL